MMKRQIVFVLTVLLLLTACGSEPYTPYPSYCKQVISGDNPYVYIITEDDSLWAWGHMGFMNLGFIPSEYEVVEPMLVLNNILDVSTYLTETQFVQTDHSLWGIGLLNMNLEHNDYQRDGITVYPVKLMEDVQSVLVTNGCRFAITKDNVLYGCGYGQYGVLGLGDEENRHSFEVLMEDVANVYVGFDTTYIVQTDGSLWACGRNSLYQLPGLADVMDCYTTPVRIADGVEKVYHSALGCYLLKLDGTLWTWGQNLTPGFANETGEMRQLVEGIKDIGDFGSYFGVLNEDDSLWSLEGYIDEEANRSVGFFHIADDVTSFTKNAYGNYYTTKDGKLYGMDGQVDKDTNYLFQLKGVPLNIEQPVVLFQPEESDEDAP